MSAVLNAMDHHKGHGRVQNIGCRALCSLLYPEYMQNKRSVHARGIEVVIVALNRHGDDAELQKLGCKFLFALAKRDEHYCNLIVQAKGLIPIIKAQMLHKGNAGVHRAAQNAIRAINASILLELSGHHGRA